MLGSNLPRDIPVSDASMTCLALVEFLSKGRFLNNGIEHRSDASKNPALTDRVSFCRFDASVYGSFLPTSSADEATPKSPPC